MSSGAPIPGAGEKTTHDQGIRPITEWPSGLGLNVPPFVGRWVYGYFQLILIVQGFNMRPYHFRPPIAETQHLPQYVAPRHTGTGLLFLGKLLAALLRFARERFLTNEAGSKSGEPAKGFPTG